MKDEIEIRLNLAYGSNFTAVVSTIIIIFSGNESKLVGFSRIKF